MLVWLTDAGWRATAAAAQPEHRAALARWADNSWPLVVRRLDDTAGDDEVCLGLPLPPDAATGAKMRVALRVPAERVARTTPALELKLALNAAAHRPPASAAIRYDSLAALCDEAEGLGLRVFGSLAMQTLTGLPYLSASSDIDLLFHPASRRQLDDGVALLARHAEHLPLDGEIVFPGGAAVSWKEWLMAAAHPAKVLVKELRSVRLADAASLLATLPTREAP